MGQDILHTLITLLYLFNLITLFTYLFIVNKENYII